MLSVRMRVDGNRFLWFLATCRTCGEAHQYLASEVFAGPVICKSCSARMEVRGTVIEATVDRAGQIAFE